jgi:predicted double-glycine peptidase
MTHKPLNTRPTKRTSGSARRRADDQRRSNRRVWLAGTLLAAGGWLARQALAEEKPLNINLRAPIRDEERRFRRYPKTLTDLRRQNVVMQQREYSCGAAALATLIRYHWGDPVSELQILREVVKLLTAEEMKERIQNGLSLTDLRRTAVRMGYLATIGKLEFEKLQESKIPLVVGITVNEFDHFVVYRGDDGYNVYLADPARGNLRTPIKEFLKQWQKNAVLVVVKPGVDEVRTSALTLSVEEKSLGELNSWYLRDRVTTRASAWPY